VTRLESWILHGATLLVGGGGMIYAWMRYVHRPTDPFAVVNHPWQPHLQHLHVIAAPFLVFALGLVWQSHVRASLRLGIAARRRSGWALAATAAPMVVSGYLLQTATAEGWRQAWLVLHLAASGLWLGGYLTHQLAARRASRSPRLPR